MATQYSDPLMMLIQQMNESNQQARREAQEREDRLRKEADDREERLLKMMKEMTTATTEATREQAEKQREADRLAQQRQEDLRVKAMALNEEYREEDKKRREHQEMLKNLPKPPPMTAKEDVADYLDMFKSNMTTREIPPAAWAYHLLPLLNTNCKAAVVSLPQEQKNTYNTLEEILLKTCQPGSQYPGQNCFDAKKDTGESFRATAVKLHRLLHRYAPERDPDVVRNKMAQELFIRTLPKKMANYVREKEPADLMDTADLASKYCKREDIDELELATDKPWTHRPDTSKDYHGDLAYHGRRPKRDFKNFKGADFKGGDRSKDEPLQSDNNPVSYDTSNQGGANYTIGRGVDTTKSNGNRARGLGPVNKWKKERDSTNEGCWECGDLSHHRAVCPKRTTATPTHKVTCLTLKGPYCTVPGFVAKHEVKRMLVDSGANISLIAEDLVPEGTIKGDTVTVEGVGDQLQKYHTADIPITIKGKTAMVHMAAPHTLCCGIGNKYPRVKPQVDMAGRGDSPLRTPRQRAKETREECRRKYCRGRREGQRSGLGERR